MLHGYGVAKERSVPDLTTRVSNLFPNVLIGCSVDWCSLQNRCSIVLLNCSKLQGTVSSRCWIEGMLMKVWKYSRGWMSQSCVRFVVHGGNRGLTRIWPHHEVVKSGRHLLQTSGLQS